MAIPRLLAVALVLAACGRTPLLGLKARDAGTPRRDTAIELDARADTAADTSVPDTRPFDSHSPMGCTALAPLARRGVLTARHAKQVLFAKDRSALVLRVAGTDAGMGDEVLVVRLPGGETSSLGLGAVDINWVEDGARVLIRNSLGDLAVSSLDGTNSVLLARGTCEHLTVPDGNRVLAFGDCDGLAATLASVDTRTGHATKLGRSTRMNFGFGPNVVVSPSGQWIAYLEPPPARDGSVSYSGIVRVVDSRNGTYALSSAGIASNPHFASDKVLLFVNDRSSYLNVDVRAHALGSGDTSWLVARDVGFDHRFEGHVSSDGQWLLAPVSPVPHDFRTPDALSAYNLDGREIALANDVFPFWGSEVLWYSFAFAADERHVVYMNLTPSSRGVSVVGRSGGASSSLSNESDFVLPLAGNLVALTEWRSQPIRLRLADLNTAQDVAVAELTATPSAVTFTPDGKSVVFAEQALGSKLARLRHLSSRTGAITDLAQWTETQMPPYEPCCNLPGPGYPIDPTGCFTVVDSDLTGGTSLILLPE